MILSESKPLFKDILRGSFRQNYKKIPGAVSHRGFCFQLKKLLFDRSQHHTETRILITVAAITAVR